MADNLRSMTKNTAENVTKEEQVLGDKATGGVDNDQDHVPNVEGGLKAAINNPNVSAKAKEQAEEKLDALK